MEQNCRTTTLFCQCCSVLTSKFVVCQCFQRRESNAVERLTMLSVNNMTVNDKFVSPAIVERNCKNIVTNNIVDKLFT